MSSRCLALDGKPVVVFATTFMLSVSTQECAELSVAVRLTGLCPCQSKLSTCLYLLHMSNWICIAGAGCQLAEPVASTVNCPYLHDQIDVPFQPDPGRYRCLPNPSEQSTACFHVSGCIIQSKSNSCRHAVITTPRQHVQSMMKMDV